LDNQGMRSLEGRSAVVSPTSFVVVRDDRRSPHVLLAARASSLHSGIGAYSTAGF
jgi:hypothetical protein